MACGSDLRKARATVYDAYLGQYGFRYLLERKTGQYVLGTLGTRHEVALPNAIEGWPQIADAALDGQNDNPPYPSEEAVRRQGLFMHGVLADQATNLL